MDSNTAKRMTDQTTLRPNAGRWSEMRQMLTAQGGFVSSAPHTAGSYDIPAQENDEDEGEDQKNVKSCACGEARIMHIPYNEHVKGERKFARVCAICDGLTHAPRFSE